MKVKSSWRGILPIFFKLPRRQFILQTKQYGRTLVNQSLKENKQQFKLAGKSSYQGKFQWKFWSRERKFSSS